MLGTIVNQEMRLKRISKLQRNAARCYARADHWREQADRCSPDFWADRAECLEVAKSLQIDGRYLSAVVRREMGIE